MILPDDDVFETRLSVAAVTASQFLTILTDLLLRVRLSLRKILLEKSLRKGKPSRTEDGTRRELNMGSASEGSERRARMSDMAKSA